MRKVIAGPWVGEFGWELMGWQGWLRAQKQEGDHFTIICQSGHEYLYQDFADEFINFDPDIKERTMWMAKDYVPAKAAINGSYDHLQHFTGKALILDPQVLYSKQWLTLKPDSPEQKFIRFGGRTGNFGVKILLHARNIDKLNTGPKNWPPELWSDLVRNLMADGYEVACIGTKQGGYQIPPALDWRGLTLRDLCCAMTSSRLVIGPSSGPIHLAALCGTPHLTWTGHSRMPERHEKTWNPLNTECHCIYSGGNEWDTPGQNWQPTVHDIYHAAKLVLTCE